MAAFLGAPGHYIFHPGTRKAAFKAHLSPGGSRFENSSGSRAKDTLFCNHRTFWSSSLCLVTLLANRRICPFQTATISRESYETVLLRQRHSMLGMEWKLMGHLLNNPPEINSSMTIALTSIRPVPQWSRHPYRTLNIPTPTQRISVDE